MYEIVEKLNPFPASNFTKTISSSYITPDFRVNIVEEKNVVSLTKISGKELRINSSYQKMIQEVKDKEAQEFIQKKIESAKWFKNAILQREMTLIKVMNAIVSHQEKYFYTGDEKLKPMILRNLLML